MRPPALSDNIEMPTLAPIVESTNASREAESNWSRNTLALLETQPEVVELLQDVQLDLQWVYARDGSLTALTTEAKWWTGCSVPRLAAESILDSLDRSPVHSCLLDPPTAGLLQAARGRLTGSPVIFALQPDSQIARSILCCGDFSEQIRSHRLFVFIGSDWSVQMRQIFDRYPGLATPTRFIRTKWSSDQIINPMITAAQDVFSSVLSRRAAELEVRQSKPMFDADPEKVLIVGGTQFRLWDDAALLLSQELIPRMRAQLFDTEAALNGSPLALLEAASACGSIVSANLCRADCNQLIPFQMPWITWVTLPAVPAFETAAPADGLILADEIWNALAQKAGWPPDRVKICSWPMRNPPPRFASPGASLGFICDTPLIEIPAAIKRFSSHRLLWDLIEEELHTDPLVVEQIDAYLSNRAAQLNISVDALDRRSFIDGLIIPAYQQGLARLLIAEKLPVHFHGKGWSNLDEFASRSRGEITSQAALETAIANSSALIYCWPERCGHPIESMGKPLIHRAGRDRAQFIRAARAAHRAIAPRVIPHESLADVVGQLLLPSRNVTNASANAGAQL